MNPHAREFVPAHVLRKRQEEANRLSELTEQLDQVGINETGTDKENGIKDNHESSSADINSTSQRISSGDNSSEGERTQNPINERETGSGGNLNKDTKYNEDIQTFNDCEDDGYLLRAGENLCEFNGEQFIIPGE